MAKRKKKVLKRKVDKSSVKTIKSVLDSMPRVADGIADLSKDLDPVSLVKHPKFKKKLLKLATQLDQVFFGLEDLVSDLDDSEVTF